MPDSTTTLAGFHHVKLPVTDVARSSDWYQRVLGLTVNLTFVEGDELMGVSMADPAGTIQLALRSDPGRAGALAGFDPIAIAVDSLPALAAWVERLDALGEPHGEVVSGAKGGAVLIGLHDPDGIEIRLYADQREERP